YGNNWIVGVEEESQPGKARHGLLDQLESLGGKFRAKEAQSGGVSARPRDVVDEASGEGVATGRHDDGDRRGLPLGRTRPWCPMGHQNLEIGRASCRERVQDVGG